MIVGNTNIYGFEVGDKINQILQTVDIIIGNYYVSCDDNAVYLLEFISDIKYTIQHLKDVDLTIYNKYYENKTIEEIHEFISNNWAENSPSYDIEDGKLYSLHRFMDWGSTTDNITSLLFLYKNELILTFQFWRDDHEPKEEINQIQYVKVDIFKIIKTLRNLVKELETV